MIIDKNSYEVETKNQLAWRLEDNVQHIDVSLRFDTYFELKFSIVQPEIWYFRINVDYIRAIIISDTSGCSGS